MGWRPYGPAVTDDILTHQPTVGDWLVIDAALDNLAAVERVGGDEAAAERAGRLREVGWAANRVHPWRGSGPVGWPPRDDALPINLTRADWEFVRGAASRALEVSRQIVDRGPSELVRESQHEDVRLLEGVLARLP